MNALFGKKENKKPQNQQDLTLKTIEDLQKKIGEMEEKINFIETKKNNLNEQAKTKLKSGDKNGARQALAKKKKYDEQIKQFDGALMLMEEQRMMLESAGSMKDIFETIKMANLAIKTTQKDMNPDDLLKVKDDLEDIKYAQQEFNGILSEFATTEDADVEDELNQMAAELEGDSLPEVGKLNINEEIKKKNENKPNKVEVDKKINNEKELEDFLMG